MTPHAPGDLACPPPTPAPHATTVPSAAPSQPASAAPGGRTDGVRLRPWGVVALLIGMFSSTYVFSSMNVALPDIGADLGADAGQLKLVMGAYATALAVCVVPAGRLGDRHGRRRLIIAGLTATLVLAVVAGLATDAWTLVVLRTLLGVSVALYLPQLLSVIQVCTTGPARARLVSAYAAAGGLGTAAGQVIGGALLRADLFGAGWRSLLWLLALLAAVALTGAITLPGSRGADSGRGDGAGVSVLALAIAGLLVPASLGPTSGWPLWTILALVAAPLLLVGFWQVERRIERARGLPLVPPAVLREPAVWKGLAVAGLFFAGFSAFMYEYALVSQGAWHETAWASGLSLLPFSLAFVVGSLAVGRGRDALGSNARVMMAGTLAQIAALGAVAAILTLSPHEPSGWLLQPVLLVLGWAQAWVYGPLLGTVMDGVPARVAGLTGGLFSMAQQTALGLGVALYGAVLTGLQSAGATQQTAMAGSIALNVVSALGVLALVRSLDGGLRAPRRPRVQ